MFASLKSSAEGVIAGGDERTRGQIMADTLVARVTGQGGFEARISTTEDTDASAHPSTTVNVTVSDRVLLGMEDGAGWVEGYGPVPRRSAPGDGRRGRLAAPPLRHPGDGRPGLDELAGRPVPARPRHVPSAPRPHLPRPILRRADPARPPIKGRAEGGPTSGPNGQGLCEACNYAKAAPGWSARPRPGPRHTAPAPRRATPTNPQPRPPTRPAAGTRDGLAGQPADPGELIRATPRTPGAGPGVLRAQPTVASVRAAETVRRALTQRPRFSRPTPTRKIPSVTRP